MVGDAEQVGRALGEGGVAPGCGVSELGRSDGGGSGGGVARDEGSDDGAGGGIVDLELGDILRGGGPAGAVEGEEGWWGWGDGWRHCFARESRDTGGGGSTSLS